MDISSQEQSVSNDIEKKTVKAEISGDSASSSLTECESSANNSAAIRAINSIGILKELELDANKIAIAVDDLTESLTGTLRNISSLTLEYLSVYKDSVNKTCDQIDVDIKLMYQVMAKCEEVNRLAKPLQKIARQVKSMKVAVDQLESLIM